MHAHSAITPDGTASSEVLAGSDALDRPAAARSSSPWSMIVRT